ncbi:hypothetical protein BDV06DRAFT_192653 [Aspergillus oleicola]
MPPGLGKAVGDPDNDDCVAQVLAKEARDSSVKYSALGMEAYMPSKPAGSAPKPNTRFLRHIIKETDNHNAALKRKEEREARERMRQLRNQPSASTRERSRDRHRDSRRTEDKHSLRKREEREDRHRFHRRRHRSRSASPDRDRPRASRRERDRDDDRHRRSRKSHRYRSYSRSRSRSPHARDSYSHRRRHRRRSRSRSRSPEPREKRKDQDSSRRKGSSAPELQSKISGDDSDPLEELVGPLPKGEAPIHSRGRGAYKPNISNIDAHFAPDYDPSLDVQPKDDEAQQTRSTRRHVPGLMTGDDDWELALEALHDRARWKQQGKDRLREAGFNNDVMERWKAGGSTAAGNEEGLLDSVKWSSKSEGREWDRGKFIDEDGHVNVKASW